MKRVIVFGVKTFPSQGGTDRVAENLILQLKEHFDITLYCYKDPKAKNNIPGIKVIEFSPWFSGAAGSFVYFFLSSLHILFTQNADLVHAHKTDSAFFIPLLRLRFPVIATSHEAPYKRDKWNKLMKLYFQMVERIFIKSSSLCTCISEPLTDYYQKKYGRKVLFIPNGINPVDRSVFNFEKARGFLPAGASLDKPFILFAARRIMKTKGCHTMVEALVKMGYKGQVFIAGELTHNEVYLEQMRETGRGLNLFFLGFVHPLNTLLALVEKSELFIFPSETEGMSIMLLEVASAGKPIIASDIPENTQVFSANEVLYFRTSNADDLASRITHALAHPEEMANLGRKCQEKVYKDYVWKNISTLYEKAYESVIN